MDIDKEKEGYHPSLNKDNTVYTRKEVVVSIFHSFLFLLFLPFIAVVGLVTIIHNPYFAYFDFYPKDRDGNLIFKLTDLKEIKIWEKLYKRKYIHDPEKEKAFIEADKKYREGIYVNADE